MNKQDIISATPNLAVRSILHRSTILAAEPLTLAVPADLMPEAEGLRASLADAASDALGRRVEVRIVEAAEARQKVYRRYLASDAWQRRRSRVLQRAGGRCEGCGEHPATEVHHLTYDHVGDEFLFELVALCSECHRRIHGLEP